MTKECDCALMITKRDAQIVQRLARALFTGCYRMTLEEAKLDEIVRATNSEVFELLDKIAEIGKR